MTDGRTHTIGNRGSLEFTFEPGGMVGVTGRTSINPHGTPTSWVTVVRDRWNGDVRTMHPGLPGDR